MSLSACQPVLMFTLITILADMGSAANAQKYKSPRGNNLVDDQHGRHHSPHSGHHQTITLNPETLAKAKRTISHLSPEARRFLFSPTIQNTITNLNQNTNTMEMKSGGGSEGSFPAIARESDKMLGYVNPESGAIEYDLTGKVKKICFILG